MKETDSHRGEEGKGGGREEERKREDLHRGRWRRKRRGSDMNTRRKTERVEQRRRK